MTRGHYYNNTQLMILCKAHQLRTELNVVLAIVIVNLNYMYLLFDLSESSACMADLTTSVG